MRRLVVSFMDTDLKHLVLSLLLAGGSFKHQQLQVYHILCVAICLGKRLFPLILLPLFTFCCIYSWGKKSEQLTLPGWGSCADLAKNRRVLCSWCDLLKNVAILERTSYQKNLHHIVLFLASYLSSRRLSICLGLAKVL